MNFEYNEKTQALLEKLKAFMNEEVYPIEKDYIHAVENGSKSLFIFFTDKRIINDFSKTLRYKRRRNTLFFGICFYLKNISHTGQA